MYLVPGVPTLAMVSVWMRSVVEPSRLMYSTVTPMMSIHWAMASTSATGIVKVALAPTPMVLVCSTPLASVHLRIQPVRVRPSNLAFGMETVEVAVALAGPALPAQEPTLPSFSPRS